MSEINIIISVKLLAGDGALSALFLGAWGTCPFSRAPCTLHSGL